MISGQMMSQKVKLTNFDVYLQNEIVQKKINERAQTANYSAPDHLKDAKCLSYGRYICICVEISGQTSLRLRGPTWRTHLEDLLATGSANFDLICFPFRP